MGKTHLRCLKAAIQVAPPSLLSGHEGVGLRSLLAHPVGKAAEPEGSPLSGRRASRTRLPNLRQGVHPNTAPSWSRQRRGPGAAGGQISEDLHPTRHASDPAACLITFSCCGFVRPSFTRTSRLATPPAAAARSRGRAALTRASSDLSFVKWAMAPPSGLSSGIASAFASQIASGGAYCRANCGLGKKKQEATWSSQAQGHTGVPATRPSSRTRP